MYLLHTSVAEANNSFLFYFVWVLAELNWLHKCANFWINWDGLNKSWK